MFRLGFVTYLVLVTLAGPAVCCCTTAQLLASLSSPAKQDGQHEPAPTSCCQHSTPAREDEAPAEKHQPDNSPCPCKQNRGQPVLSTAELGGPSLPDLRLVPADWVFTSLLDLQSSLALSAFRPVSGDLWGLPFLSTCDILLSMHMLRC